VGQSLVRELSFRDFAQAFAFLERLARDAVDYSRRPDMCIFGFNRVRLTIANPHHSGLTEAELRLARKVDAILTGTGSRSASGDRRPHVEARTRQAA
jgi:pterin-4a-carbinolamine dehydratase